MVRSELLERLLEAHPHLPRHAVELALDTMLNAITVGLAHGHNFSCRVSEARMGRNPRTGEAVSVERKRILRFRAGGHILERLNRPTTLG